jgi:hypothetical protein
LSSANFQRAPGLLGPIFEEAGTGERQVREALFLTFNIDLGFFEARLLGPVRATGAAVTVVADSSMFAPDPRNVRSAGNTYALGLAVTRGAFHPKLSVLVGPERALVGIGSGNLTVGGWHANEEVLTIVRADRETGAPTLLRDVVAFLRGLVQRVTISQLALDGIERTAAQLETLLDSTDPVATGHSLADSLRGPILDQLPTEPLDTLEIAAPFHDLGAKALTALIERYGARRVAVLAQPGRAVMDPATMQGAAVAAGCQLDFVQIDGDDERSSRYRHGKVITGLRDGRAVWTLVGSANVSAAALLGRAPAANVEISVLHRDSTSLLPTPTLPVADVPALHYTLAVVGEDEPASNPPGATLLEARAVDGGIEVTISSSAPVDLTVEVSPFASSPDSFTAIGVVPSGHTSSVFRTELGPGTRVRIGDQWQFLAFPDHVVRRLLPTGAGRPNHDTSFAEIFASDAAARQWLDAMARLTQTHSGAGRPGVSAMRSDAHEDHISASWRTLEDDDSWSAYSEDALTRLGMPIFHLAAGLAPSLVGASLPNAAPAWEDRFDETAEAFEEGETVESVEELDDVVVTAEPVLSSHQRGRLRAWLVQVVGLMPHLGPYERIAVCQLAISGSAALIWDETAGPSGWFAPLAHALETMTSQPWPSRAASQAAAVTALGLIRLRMAVPADERGPEAKKFFELSAHLQPLTSTATAEAIGENLNVLAGTTRVSPTADEVLDELADYQNFDPRHTFRRLLVAVLPHFDTEWLDSQRVRLRGHTPNPLSVATLALSQATHLAHVAVGVTAEDGKWAVIGKIPGRLIVVDGDPKRTAYRTYDVSGLINPVVVLTDKDQARKRRLSLPPWTVPGDIDREVLNALEVGDGPL